MYFLASIAKYFQFFKHSKTTCKSTCFSIEVAGVELCDLKNGPPCVHVRTSCNIALFRISLHGVRFR